MATNNWGDFGWGVAPWGDSAVDVVLDGVSAVASAGAVTPAIGLTAPTPATLVAEAGAPVRFAVVIVPSVAMQLQVGDAPEVDLSPRVIAPSVRVVTAVGAVGVDTQRELAALPALATRASSPTPGATPVLTAVVARTASTVPTVSLFRTLAGVSVTTQAGAIGLGSAVTAPSVALRTATTVGRGRVYKNLTGVRVATLAGVVTTRAVSQALVPTALRARVGPAPSISSRAYPQGASIHVRAGVPILNRWDLVDNSQEAFWSHTDNRSTAQWQRVHSR